MSLPSEISDLAKQLQAKLGEALPGYSVALDIGVTWYTLTICPKDSFEPVFRQSRRTVEELVAGAMDLLSDGPGVDALAKEAIERAKGEGK